MKIKLKYINTDIIDNHVLYIIGKMCIINKLTHIDEYILLVSDKYDINYEMNMNIKNKILHINILLNFEYNITHNINIDITKSENIYNVIQQSITTEYSYGNKHLPVIKKSKKIEKQYNIL